MKTYKVLANGASCHGGKLKWIIPKGSKPGAWHESPGETDLCHVGLHVTAYPDCWWSPGKQVYEVEVEDEHLAPDGMKSVCRRVRLLRRVSWREYAAARGVRVLRCTP